MRVCVATTSTSRIGGAEDYLADVILGLQEAGVELAVVCEYDARVLAVDREARRGTTILAPACDGIRVFARDRHPTSADLLQQVRDWRPDLLFMHGLSDARLEAALAEVAPTVFFVHGYHGTCISGGKRHAFPTMRPCSRTFGPACLMYYYPRRCGGLNPLTMARMYRTQQQRLRTVRRCDAVVTTSPHMYSEYAKHGVESGRLHLVPLYSPDLPIPARALPLPQAGHLPARSLDGASARLMYLGRFDRNKGMQLLIDATPLVARSLGRAVRVTLAGDGPQRATLERRARRAQESHREVAFEFPGWLDRAGVATHLAASEILVVPSVWPEPFGLVGLEAARLGIPAAAFAVGGITSWLSDGVNGHLADADPPTAIGLAGAIVACLRDDATYQRLRRGAADSSGRFTRESHLKALLSMFDNVLAERCASSTNPRIIASLVGATP